MIKVMLVDDSALVRNALEELFNRAPDIEVVASAPDPFIAADKLKRVVPDVILLDVEMPKMDGLTFLRKLMNQHPIPVIICSTLVGDNSTTHIQALELGAVDIIQKPKIGLRQFVEQHQQYFFDVVRAAAQSRLKPLIKRVQAREKHNADVILPSGGRRAMHETTEKLIIIGASTGGTEAIKTVLMGMPSDCPAIAIVQHMPEGFTKSFAARLDSLCQINVREATDNMSLLRGHAVIAPGNMHMMIRRSGARYMVQLQDGPPVSRHKPSVDVLMRSAANYVGSNAVGIILTGMGDDGAAGLLEMREAGAHTIGQDETSSVVYGMPKEAYKKGAVVQQLPLERICAAALKEAGY
ncbi:chemotaxis response regulator protein-glutamate methylesterase [Bowmanella sp. JS7-9]|uniref:Protein-glutamate methylesterase/protein-glutamine glutaminase n=1 Tax=Pseudobowmanella zhangzhouensis TaxID=1537679 RepID=A0ABW1XKF7_9ALTE|nr:chemotaxis response regulator protein-glutamate methylesterase [Bowmanella sp. JS7-9]TBX20598.1 chemotaxis protein CheY [Bowmanella sp. JS7-9]